jgi:hypothetical protein
MAALPLPSTADDLLPLWELEGTRNRVLMLGSIHLLRPSDYPLDPAIDRALDQADVVLMELDMDDLEPVAVAATSMALAIDPQGRGLEQLLGPGDWRTAQTSARRTGLDLTPLAGFEPWYAAVLISQLRLAELGFDASHGVEARITADATDRGKEIRGLETLEEQLAALDRLSPGAQRRFLLQTLEEAATIDGQVDDIIDSWKSGDTEDLDQELLDGVRDQPEAYRALIVRRNQHFANRIAGLANSADDYLVVMGTLHLVGADSVLAMLEKRGLRARQLPAD